MFLKAKMIEMEMEMEMLQLSERWQALVYITTVITIGVTFIAIILANKNRNG